MTAAANTPGYTCGHCGKTHEGIPTDLAYRRPAHYLMVPEAERATRCKENDDLVIVDDRHFLIRGVFRVPIIDGAGGHLTWGLWAAVSERSFGRYWDRYDEDAHDEPRFRGLLAVSPLGYPSLMDLEVEIQLRSATERPLFEPGPGTHPLFDEHRQGITTARWHEIVHVAMPWLFEA